MSGKDKNPPVPRLRFPEFREAGVWSKVAAGQLFSNRIERGRSGLPIYSVTMTDGLVPRASLDRKVDDIAEAGANKAVRTGDIAYNMMRMWQGAVGVAPKDCMVSPAYIILKPQDVNPFFFYFLLKMPQTLRVLTAHSRGLTEDRLRLYYDDFAKVTLLCPSFSEQDRIADCLFSSDALIAAETQKLETLKTHKKGLLQQLFPREGETVPRLRFPEFRDAREWEEIALGEVAEIQLGKMLDGKKHTTGKLLPYLNNLSVRWNDVHTSNLPKMYFDNDELDRFGLRAGDVLICEGGEPGRSAVWDGRTPDLKFQKAIHRVRFNVPFEPQLLVLYLESIAGTARFEKLFTGGGIKHLTRDAFNQLKIPITSYAEQLCIASCLSSLGGLITDQARKIEALKTHKKGLLQQLFPVVDELAA